MDSAAGHPDRETLVLRVLGDDCYFREDKVLRVYLIASRVMIVSRWGPSSLRKKAFQSRQYSVQVAGPS